jgi:hypothetical protein
MSLFDPKLHFRLQAEAPPNRDTGSLTPGWLTAASDNLLPSYFCVFFAILGEFLDSRNPVNYLFVTPVSLAKA